MCVYNSEDDELRAAARQDDDIGGKSTYVCYIDPGRTN